MSDEKPEPTTQPQAAPDKAPERPEEPSNTVFKGGAEPPKPRIIQPERRGTTDDRGKK